VVSSSGSVVEAASSTNTADGAGGSGGASNSAALSLVEGGGSLTIQTTDGVQIKVRFGTAGVGALSQGGGSTSAAVLNVGSMQVEVDGHLSSADTQAVSDVLSQVDSLASQYFSGDVQDAFAAAASLSADPSEIAGMNLNLLYTSHVYQATTISNASGDNTQASSAPQASTATSTASGNLVSTDTSSTGSSTGGTTRSEAPPLQVILEFLREVSGKLGRNTSTAQVKVPSSLKLDLLARVIGQQAQAGPAQAAAQLAGATLGRMAG
jgi:hypothetical protein